MEEEYVSYKTAKALAEAGFDWPCDTEWVTTPGTIEPRLATEMAAVDYGRVYGPENVNRTKAPTLEQAEKWLVDVKGVHMMEQDKAMGITISLKALQDLKRL